MHPLTRDILARASLQDLHEARRVLAPLTLSHGSAFAANQYRKRLAELDAEIDCRQVPRLAR